MTATLKDEASAIAGELRGQATRIIADSPPAAAARQHADTAVDAVTAALAADPTLAERQQRNLDLIRELLRRLPHLARQASAELKRRRLDAAGASSAHLGLTNRAAPDEVIPVAERLAVIADQVTSATWPDWDTPRRRRELSAMRLPGTWQLARIADELRRAIAPALATGCPDPEAVRLAAVADAIHPAADTTGD